MGVCGAHHRRRGDERGEMGIAKTTRKRLHAMAHAHTTSVCRRRALTKRRWTKEKVVQLNIGAGVCDAHHGRRGDEGEQQRRRHRHDTGDPGHRSSGVLAVWRGTEREV